MHILTARAADLTPSQVEAWTALEARAAEPNGYASPAFLLPMLEALDRTLDHRVFLCRPEVGAALAGAVVIVARGASRVVPVAHLEVYRPLLSACAAPLIEADAAPAVLAACLKAAREVWPQAGALVLGDVEEEGTLHRALQAACGARRLELRSGAVQTRAMMQAPLGPAEAGDAVAQARAKDIDRMRRRLAKAGALDWKVHLGAIPSPVVDDFMRLEHLGWKGEAGTSLRANPAQEVAVRRAIEAFGRRGQALFTELRLDGRVIASTANFISGGRGFAFKIGWDPAYRKYGVGVLSELELQRDAWLLCPQLVDFDSGAVPGSYIDKLWTGRRRLITLTVPLSRTAAWALGAVDGLRLARGAWRAWRAPDRSTRTVPEAAMAAPAAAASPAARSSATSSAGR